MRLLSIEKLGDKGFAGYVEDGHDYKSFVLIDGEARIESEYPKMDFKDYEHFRGVIGKFDPEAVFLINPIRIEELTQPALEAACALLPDGYALEYSDDE